MYVEKKMIAEIPQAVSRFKKARITELNNEFVCPWSSAGIKLVPMTEQAAKVERPFFSPRTPIVIKDNTVGEVIDFRF